MPQTSIGGGLFRQLRIKLTVLYAGLFCAALLLIGATTYAVIGAATQSMAADQLNAARAAFSQVLQLRAAHLREGAAHAASSEGFRAAMVTHDQGALSRALTTLQQRIEADFVFVVTAEGLQIGEDGAGDSSVAPGLQRALAQSDRSAGVVLIDGAPHFAAITRMSGGLGWIVAGDRLDADMLAQLGELSAVPLHANVLVREGDGGWGARDLPDRAAINGFIERALAGGAGHAINTPDARAIGVAAALPGLDDTPAVLLLSYKTSDALSPYRPVFNALIAIGFVGLVLLIVCTWLLARSITQPLSTLEEATRKLRNGVYEPVIVRTRDEISRVAASFNAMIGAIREREQKITQLAYHDAETRLPNRLALERRLASAPAQRLYLAAIGIDRFADVRGAIGYSHAGALMNRLGARLARLAPNGPMARLASDVLGIAFLAESEEAARKRADALVSHLEQPLELDGHVVDVNVAIGVAQPRAKDETPAAMIERASIALDQARSARTKAAFFDEAAYGDPARNLSLMSEMRRALENGEMRLAHQPKFNFRTGRIDSAESLVRWRHPTRGLISPDLFVPMAEETGHIGALTDWVLERAITEQAELAAAGFPLALSVNISGRLLGDANFAKSALARAKRATQPLCFEITETAVIDNPKQALDNIELFAANGVRIAIDDYGSGLSSLAYLKQMPAHELKIDKLFVQNITASERDALLVRSTIELAHGLGLEVTAEGVETPAAFALLASMGCDLAQGYLIARPAPLEELLVVLNDRQRLRFYQQTARIGAEAATAASPGDTGVARQSA